MRTSSVTVHRILVAGKGFSVPSGLCALGLMTKVPEPGKVKTRLTPPLTPKEAAELNRCFLRDMAKAITAATRQAAAEGVAVYTPVGAEQAYQGILPQDFHLISQRGSDFGERLAFAAEDLFSTGFSSVCLINSDSPTVPSTSFAEAATELLKKGERVVIGPSDDGGYYLIGMKRLHLRLFQEIDWSTDRVLAQTLTRAADSGIEVHQLSAGYDVDDRNTLHRLCSELLGVDGGPREEAPNTRAFLSDIIAREGRARIWPV